MALLATGTHKITMNLAVSQRGAVAGGWGQGLCVCVKGGAAAALRVLDDGDGALCGFRSACVCVCGCVLVCGIK